MNQTSYFLFIYFLSVGGGEVANEGKNCKSLSDLGQILKELLRPRGQLPLRLAVAPPPASNYTISSRQISTN